MSGEIKCFICSEQLPLRVEELSKSFNVGLLTGMDEDGGIAPDDDNDPDFDDGNDPNNTGDSKDDSDDDDNDDDDDDDDESDDGKKHESVLEMLLFKARELLQKVPRSPSFKFINQKSKPATSPSEVSTGESNTRLQCAICRKVYKTLRGWTLHQASHKL